MGCTQHTDRQNTLPATSEATGRILYTAFDRLGYANHFASNACGYRGDLAIKYGNVCSCAPTFNIVFTPTGSAITKKRSCKFGVFAPNGNNFT